MTSDELTPEFIRTVREGGRERITKMYAQFAALDRLIAAGRIKRVRGGYQIGDGAAYEQVGLLISGATISANGRMSTVKLMKRTKKFDATARKFGVDTPSE
ncbi:hypothetical protein [Peristeroidobacter soli]|jgi:hypothetical protein|uniref:hypothetical protein n=1 Tax=Peristeroidobacter soli TaxID=2497877 RepID=UPI00101C580E|nr:hypothetical protein [Peristeroidobacter soli]